jgi:hypothetical protein
MTWIRLAVMQPIPPEGISLPLHKRSQPFLATVSRSIFWNRQPSAQFLGNLMDFLSQRTLYRIRKSLSASNSTDVGRINPEFLCDSYIQPAIQSLR